MDHSYAKRICVENKTPDQTYAQKVRKPDASCLQVPSLVSSINSDHQYSLPVHQIPTSYSRTPVSLDPVNLNGQKDTIIIQGKSFDAFDVPGDGNCSFHCISLAIHGNIFKATFYRKLICKTIFDNWDDWKDYALLCHDLESSSSSAYFENMVTGNGWATACEVQAASLLLECSIVTWLRGGRFNKVSRSYEICYNEPICYN